MTNSIFAFDTSDLTLGEFFRSCKLDLEAFFQNNNNTSIRYIHGNQLNDLNISIVLENMTSFIFGAYSHGSENSLVVSATTPYISTELNNEAFENAFFYTWSCSSGKVLGKSLIDNKCACFIGYKDIISIWSTHQKPFVETATLGLKLFIENVSTHNIPSLIKEKYNDEIDEIYKKNFMIASILMDNRDALVIHGIDMTISDLNN
ncbi:hypothetical protein SAMN04487765_3283 [Tenacibaculum sp. MAR_2010_89]|uniref:hypothetical protein n=1 Tax=Tenacibaculum sp. MAR_2010_89 TaxID=1250198 RepID=UPI000894C083|nr:hypothetical protein [Tenacibaculum sp. MAR_2010_89]SEE59134.1 hypothetical protein SAMN04487765_3283 [Tenacibaculum sp. MAR_2010_89]